MSETPRDEEWEASLGELGPMSCGRLDMSTSLMEPVRVGRVESDQVRYIYHADGTESIVLGRYCDQVAYAAARYSVERRPTPEPAPTEAADGESN